MDKLEFKKQLDLLLSACTAIAPEPEFKVYGGERRREALVCTPTISAELVKRKALASHYRVIILECYNSRGGMYLGSFYVEPNEDTLVTMFTHGDDGGAFCKEVFAKFNRAVRGIGPLDNDEFFDAVMCNVRTVARSKASFGDYPKSWTRKSIEMDVCRTAFEQAADDTGTEAYWSTLTEEERELLVSEFEYTCIYS